MSEQNCLVWVGKDDWYATKTEFLKNIFKVLPLSCSTENISLYISVFLAAWTLHSSVCHWGSLWHSDLQYAGFWWASIMACPTTAHRNTTCCSHKRQLSQNVSHLMGESYLEFRKLFTSGIAFIVSVTSLDKHRLSELEGALEAVQLGAGWWPPRRPCLSWVSALPHTPAMWSTAIYLTRLWLDSFSVFSNANIFYSLGLHEDKMKQCKSNT